MGSAAGSVEVHLFAAARAAVGAAQVTMTPGRLSALLEGLAEQHPRFAAVRPQCSFLLDGEAVHGDPDVPAGSRIDVLPPFAGG